MIFRSEPWSTVFYRAGCQALGRIYGQDSCHNEPILGLETSPKEDSEKDFLEDFCEVDKSVEKVGGKSQEVIIAEGENQQESLKRQYLPDPKLPSAKEVEEHNIGHYP